MPLLRPSSGGARSSNAALRATRRLLTTHTTTTTTPLLLRAASTPLTPATTMASTPTSTAIATAAQFSTSAHARAAEHADAAHDSAHAGAAGDHGHGGEHHESRYDQPGGWLFGIKPGEKYEKEGWEGIWLWGFCGSLVVGVVGYAFKPDTSIQTWALEEARRRLEVEGILKEPDSD